ncbi:hypothetical protein GRI33_07110 [Brucella sp. BO3]|uniref:hypothetical protein n=1 Tax=Brucella TaxID=234 RepID=UPI00073ABA0D|nr:MULTISPECIES: hypothetical protein [unclassified Brucella]OEI85077.1 hypothetical protein BA060_00265 [Brucella sp. B13-0095]QMV26704.1 hypothetical protein GRI33_07110 [Brucella sp. BO3]CUW43948.1 hypothetical protein BF3285c1_1269 [Brucella vulpis]CUW50081.1 hypothetical protein B3286c1_1268 [Brucella vulpis]
MIDASIDQALFDAAITLVNPPALMRPYFDDSVEGQKLIRKIEAQAEKNAQELQQFVRNGEELKASLRSVFSTHLVEPHHLENLDRIILAIENRASKLSSELAPLLKNLKQTFAAVSSYLPKHKAELDRLHGVVGAQCTTEINELTDAALFLRALKAEYSPSSHGGIAFSNSKDLEGYLNRLLS